MLLSINRLQQCFSTTVLYNPAEIIAIFNVLILLLFFIFIHVVTTFAFKEILYSFYFS